MHRFKKMLKIGISKLAHSYRIKTDRYPQIITPEGHIELKDLGKIEVGLINTLFNHLFQKDIKMLSKGKPMKGRLSIVDYGDLIILADPNDGPSIKLFAPPNAEALFEQAWAKIAIDGHNMNSVPDDLEAQNSPPMPAEHESVLPVSPSPLSNTDAVKSSPGDITPQPNISSPSPQVEEAVPPLPSGINTDGYQGGLDSPLSENVGLGVGQSIDMAEPQVASIPNPIEVNRDDIAIDEQDLKIPDQELGNIEMNPPFKYDDEGGNLASEEQLGFNLPGSIDSLEMGSKEPVSSDLDRFALSQDLGLELPSQGDPSLVADDITMVDASVRATSSGIDEIEPYRPDTPQMLRADALKTTEAIPSRDTEVSYEGICYGALQKDEAISDSESGSIQAILKEMIKNGASDLHLTLGQVPRMRIDGEIVKVSDQVIDELKMKELLDPVIPLVNKKQFVETNDTDFAYEIKGVARFRFNIFRDMNGVGAVARFIPSEILSADQLGLAPSIRGLCSLHKGLVLVTGPTGSGKSTTLAGMIDLINSSRSQHIVTIEDPIEFVHKQKRCLVNQRQVHRHTESFSKALRAALREDPDIVLIGEMRDLETISIALETAETGHLVFGTLHTNTAISTVSRIIDQFPSNEQEQIRVMLADSLNGVISQTLLKKKGGGRVAAHEVLIVNHAVRSNIRENKIKMIPSHMQTQKADGNMLLNEALLNLVKTNQVTPEVAFEKAIDRNELLALFSRNGISAKI